MLRSTSICRGNQVASNAAHGKIRTMCPLMRALPRAVAAQRQQQEHGTSAAQDSYRFEGRVAGVPQSVSLEAVEFASLDQNLCLSRRLVGAVTADPLRCVPLRLASLIQSSKDFATSAALLSPESPPATSCCGTSRSSPRAPPCPPSRTSAARLLRLDSASSGSSIGCIHALETLFVHDNCGAGPSMPPWIVHCPEAGTRHDTTGSPRPR